MSGRSTPSSFLALLLVAVVAAPAAAAAAGPVEAKLQRLEGGRVTLSELRGAPLLLDLWATWCAPCVAQAEVLGGLEEELAARDVEVLAVNIGESKGTVEGYVAKSPKEYPVALDRGQVLPRLLEIAELPALVLLRADGSVAEVRRGLTRREEVLAMLALLD